MIDRGGINYKELDRKILLKYLSDNKDRIITITELKENSDTEPLRIDALVFELGQLKYIKVVERYFWGAPKAVSVNLIDESTWKSLF